MVRWFITAGDVGGAMSKHTPGPWVIEWNPNAFRYFVHGYDNTAVCKLPDSRTPDENKANAHLIAAAPELWEICKLAQEYFDSHPITSKDFLLIDKIQQAFLKVEVI